MKVCSREGGREGGRGERERERERESRKKALGMCRILMKLIKVRLNLWYFLYVTSYLNFFKGKCGNCFGISHFAIDFFKQ